MALTGRRLYIWKTYVTPYIKLKECVETTGSEDYGKCCTCGKIKRKDEFDVGHFIPGHKNAYLFEEMGLHLQCRFCNRGTKKYGGDAGRPHEYTEYMNERYGREVTEEFRKLKWTPKKLTELDLERIKNDYKQKIKELEE